MQIHVHVASEVAVERRMLSQFKEPLKEQLSSFLIFVHKSRDPEHKESSIVSISSFLIKSSLEKSFTEISIRHKSKALQYEQQLPWKSRNHVVKASCSKEDMSSSHMVFHPINFLFALLYLHYHLVKSFKHFPGFPDMIST